MSNSNFVSFHSQAWESTYTKWQKLTFDLVNFGKDDSPSIDVQKYLRRRSHAKITTDNLQVHLYTFNFLATIRDQDSYPSVTFASLPSPWIFVSLFVAIKVATDKHNNLYGKHSTKLLRGVDTS